MNKQKILQLSVALVAVLGSVATVGPEITNYLPEKWRPIGLSMVALAIAVEKVLISTNQILVGPAALQTPATQDKLAAMAKDQK